MTDTSTSKPQSHAQITQGHTSAPWRVMPTSRPTQWLVVAGDDTMDRHNGDSFSLQFKEANARLIAAAPDLLESLQHAVQIIRKYVPADALGINSQGGGDGYNDQSWPVLDEYLHYMDAAIAKATGA